MSLIGDALRKTRQEAAERESDRTGVLFSAKIADSPTHSHLGLGLALGAVIAVAATVAGGGAVWWLLSRGEAPQKGSLDSSAPATSVVAETTESPIPTPVPSPAIARDEAQPTSARKTPSEVLTEPGPTAFDADQPVVQPTGNGDAPATTSSENQSFAEGFAGIEDGNEVYILEANLGKVHLSLDFIVFRADDPFTEINGVELHVGGVIDGYRVKAIERDRVRLSNGRRTIVLRAP